MRDQAGVEAHSRLSASTKCSGSTDGEAVCLGCRCTQSPICQVDGCQHLCGMCS